MSSLTYSLYLSQADLAVDNDFFSERSNVHHTTRNINWKRTIVYSHESQKYQKYFSCFAGLTNHEEYSLVRELSDSERLKTLTMKRDKSIAKDQKKLDEMKKKLHTDDERERPYYTICKQEYEWKNSLPSI